MARPRRPIRAWQLPEERPALQGQAAAMEAALEQALVCSLGALPVLLPLCAQLGLRAIINRRCCPGGEAPEDLDVGVVALVLALNRLQAPAPLVHVEEWVAQSTLGDLPGVDAAQCNDDRLARTLDTLLPHLHHRGRAEAADDPAQGPSCAPPPQRHPDRRAGDRPAVPDDLDPRCGGAGRRGRARWPLCARHQRPAPGRRPDAGAIQVARCAGEADLPGQRPPGGATGLCP